MLNKIHSVFGNFDRKFPIFKRLAMRGASLATKRARIIFEHKKIRTVLGSHLVLAVLAVSTIPQPSSAAYFANTTELVIHQDSIQIATLKGFVYPVHSVRINQSYTAFHPGIDLGGSMGDSIRPAMSGRVVLAQSLRHDYGNHIVIDHGNNVYTLYAHLNKIYVKVGDAVTHDTILGEMGTTGRSTGPHLHFELHENGRRLNPFLYLTRR